MGKHRAKKRVCVVIPAYNEAPVIKNIVEGLIEKLNKTSYSYTIVVIDDGSKDSTAQKAKEAGAYVISHILNTGAGGATATGLSYAEQNGFDIAVTMDADGQHSADDVIRGIDILSASDIDLLIGSRLIESDGMSKVKVIGNKGLSAFTYILFGINTTDSQSGLRVFSKNSLKKLRWSTSGYEFCSEMLWRAKQASLKIDEYPIKAIYTEYSRSKGQNNWNAINIVKTLVSKRITELMG